MPGYFTTQTAKVGTGCLTPKLNRELLRQGSLVDRSSLHGNSLLAGYVQFTIQPDVALQVSSAGRVSRL